MPESNCPRCGSNQFEAVRAQHVEGISRSVIFIQCLKCGGVVGVLDSVNLGIQALNFRDEVNRTMDQIRRKFK